MHVSYILRILELAITLMHDGVRSIKPNVFNVEKNEKLFELTKLILESNLSDIPAFVAWRKYFTRYVDPKIVHRKRNIKELEGKFGADFFQIIFVAHLLAYALARQFLGRIDLPSSLEPDLKDDLFESMLDSLSDTSRRQLAETTKELLLRIDSVGDDQVYDLFESIYRSIIPSEVRTPLGEYFTPLSLARQMVLGVDDKFSKDLWVDNSSGFGVFLLAYLEKFGIERLANFICIEANPLSVFIAKVILVSRYKNDLSSVKKFPIYWGDSLLNEEYSYDDGEIVVSGDFSRLHGRVGVVIGNPPWVGWKSMTKEYQERVGEDWRSYDIFEKNITRKTLGACNDDLSSYFVYFSIDKFLKNAGVLHFVINLSLFKSNLAGKLFRQFYIKKSQTPFRVNKIYDFSDYKIIPSVTNSYGTFEAEKGQKTIYPLPYYIVRGRKNRGIESIVETAARPVNNEPNGALITLGDNESEFSSIEGVCDYRARAGVCTWLNSVYWVRKVTGDDEVVTIENLGSIGKKKVKELEAEVEKDLLFRLLRARNLANSQPVIENYIVVPQQKSDMSKPIPEAEMRRKYPKALSFFSEFSNELRGRSGYEKFLKKQPFYALYNVGPYTTAPIKIGWQFVSKKFQVYLVDNARDIVPDLNVMFIPLEDIDEAYYLHALLNSTYATQKIESSSNWTFPASSIQKVRLKKFNPRDELHAEISRNQKNILKETTAALEGRQDELFRKYWFSGKN